MWGCGRAGPTAVIKHAIRTTRQIQANPVSLILCSLWHKHKVRPVTIEHVAVIEAAISALQVSASRRNLCASSSYSFSLDTEA